MIEYPKTKKTSTEDSFTASEKSSITHSSDANSTYSTSAFESNVSSTLTVNTLSMISTPWSTESWNMGTLDEFDSKDAISSSIFSFSDETISISNTTLLPRSTTTCGPVTPPFPSSRTTVTVLNVNSVNTISNSVKPMTRQSSKVQSETFSSWTVETFTSPGWVTELNSKVIKVKYPWSPNSVMSGTDIYPSSLDTLTSRKESRVTLATTATFGSRKGEQGHITPMNYIGRSNRPGGDQIMKWAQVKRIPSITAAM
ncbi:hypothetical protein ABMA27_007216 [Loxostege sticticalis]|uniref:Uncharacterized protein n=1 Tax=Loxostege sticticalis TaxID=481309 RepID=A0ABR3HEM9_LOXSC